MVTTILFGTKITQSTKYHEFLGLKTLAHIDNLDDKSQNPSCIKRRHVIAPPRSILPSNHEIRDGSHEEICFHHDNNAKQNGHVHDHVDVKYYGDDHDDRDDGDACWASYGRGGVDKRKRFPPPIPLLARTGNLTCHMPWYLKRIYKDDGSLVIKEVRVKHHEYFRAHRQNGRLTLHLVELDDHSPLFAPTTATRSKGDAQHVHEISATSPSSICLVDDDDDNNDENYSLDYDEDCNQGGSELVKEFGDELKKDCSDHMSCSSDSLEMAIGKTTSTSLSAISCLGLSKSKSSISCLESSNTKGCGKMCFGSEGTSPLPQLGILGGMPMVHGY